MQALQTTGGTSALIAGDRPELNLGGGFEVAEKINDEKDAAFEQGDDGEGAVLVKFADGSAQLTDTAADAGGGDVVSAGRPGHWPAAVGVRRFSSSEILAVRGPLIFRSMPFSQEARALLSSSSWAKQRPA